ncbi:uncharacterized protein LOC116288596 [Actinia tenebrosa]|uniref:Uncharacterized protein LOC116288596 n=1 Tax=Actinia tenebrosa TaxID=6105 RepID=A0A6P8H7I2_ACTTE|nr:uncharacterized protein LOC116288596 [Actinia tenebrosa]
MYTSYSQVLRVLVLCFLLVTCRTFEYCKKIDAAKCETDEGTIDLWKLARSDGQPKFKDIPDNKVSNQYYSFNPGKSWSDTRRQTGDFNSCQNIAACMRYSSSSAGDSIYANIGTQSSVDFIHNPSDGTCTMSLKGQYLSTNTKTLITIICNEEEEGKLDLFVADERSGSWTYTSTLQTKHACFSPLSIGSIILITFVSVVVVYFVAGIVFNKFKRGASGKDICPNYGFWSDLPFLVKDGIVFSVQTCRSKVSGRKEDYASI